MKKILRHTLGMSGVTVVSRVSGWLRDKVLAYLLGRSLFNDAYQIAFALPSMLRALLAEGALHAAFVPTLSRIWDEDEEGGEARALVRELLGTMVLILAVTVTLGAFFADPLLRLLIRFRDSGTSSETFEVALWMTRIMFGYLAFISLAALAQGILNVRDRFLIPAATPIGLNVAIVAAALYGASNPAIGPAALPFGVLLGGALQLLVQLPAVASEGMRVSADWRHLFSPRVRKILLLMLPGIPVLGISVINQFVALGFAAGTGEGGIAVRFYAYRVTELVYGVVVVQLVTVMLPTLSRQLLDDPAQARTTLRQTLGLSLVATLPATALLFVLAPSVVDVLYGGGRFDASAVELTAATLVAYSLGLPFLGFGRVMANAFFARKETALPLIGSGAALMTFAVACTWLTPRYGVPGIGAANSLSMLVYAISLTAVYRWRHGDFGLARLGLSWLQLGLAATLVAVPVQRWAAPWCLELPGRPVAFLGLLLIGALSGALFLAIAAALGAEAPRTAITVLRKRISRS